MVNEFIQEYSSNDEFGKVFEIVGCCEPCINLELLKQRNNFTEYKSRQCFYNNVLCQKTYHRLLIKRKK